MKYNNLLYVVHAYDVCPNHSNGQLDSVLSVCMTTVVAMTAYLTVRYKEAPATECRTFMESIKRNYVALRLRFKDNKNDVFVNESNYLKKFQRCLYSKDNPKWKKIAHKGRKHVLENLSNSKSIEKLVNIMYKDLGGKNVQI